MIAVSILTFVLESFLNIFLVCLSYCAGLDGCQFVDMYYDDYSTKELIAGINTINPPGLATLKTCAFWKNNHNGTQLNNYGGGVECTGCHPTARRDSDGWFFTGRS